MNKNTKICILCGDPDSNSRHANCRITSIQRAPVKSNREGDYHFKIDSVYLSKSNHYGDHDPFKIDIQVSLSNDQFKILKKNKWLGIFYNTTIGNYLSRFYGLKHYATPHVVDTIRASKGIKTIQIRHYISAEKAEEYGVEFSVKRTGCWISKDYSPVIKILPKTMFSILPEDNRGSA